MPIGNGLARLRELVISCPVGTVSMGLFVTLFSDKGDYDDFYNCTHVRHFFGVHVIFLGFMEDMGW